MSKKNALNHQTVQTIINDYLQAVRLVHGDNRTEQTEVTYRKGWFYIRHPWYTPETLSVPYRPHEIKELTAELRMKISAKG
jgi:hypothetical protein